MLDKEYTEDFTQNAEILYEFHIDNIKKENFKYKIRESIDLCTGLFSKGKKRKLESFIKEIDSMSSYYITDNNYLYTINGNFKQVYDLGLSYDLSREPQEYINSNDCYLISAMIDSMGCGQFERNENNEYIGCFGYFDGTACFTIWDIFEEDIYSVLKQYIKEEKIDSSILKEIEI